ncbi:Protein RGF1 INDUCIBLE TRANSCRIPTION FACTOR 1, partial [Linum grandiflorum]
VPVWLEPLLATKFFNRCSAHRDGNRTECNIFCLDCCDAAGAFCPYCRSASHEDHTVVQIRKSSYHNVVRVAAMENLLELSDVQPYIINSAQVAFLNERPTKNGSSSSSSSGAICGRSLLDDCRFCSLGCKVM